MIKFESKNKYGFDDLVRLVALLRQPDGCAWDAAQTHESIKRNLLEEAYEAAEAIDDKDTAHLCEELGDVLLQVVFHSQMESEAGGFDINEVSHGVCEKLIKRHPHLFAESDSADAEQALFNWDEIKRKERGQRLVSEELKGVSRALPALWRADKLLSKAAKAGAADESAAQAAAAVRKSARSLERASAFDAAGELLFAAVRYCLASGVDPEEALSAKADEFIARFAAAEQGEKREFTKEEISAILG
ncbi:MAG: nucleoside triphosphate pyrophosphohydrolase [Oscillospiraceae bacterium]|nr:nucleoside triphosphate pyrophosphohydrolase [Oscillospiraceae bacterium]